MLKIRWILWLISINLLASTKVVLCNDGAKQDVNLDKATLSLAVFIPFTDEGKIVDEPGLSQMSAALMAIDHFNKRDNSVITEIQSLTAGCNITFGRTNAIDTGTTGHLAIESLTNYIDKYGAPPDAIAGPYNEIPSRELSVLATSRRIPIVATRANSNLELTSPKFHPFLTHIYPDSVSDSLVILDYLNDHIYRSNYTAILYSFTTTMSTRMEMFRLYAEKINMKTATFPFEVDDVGRNIVEDRSPENAVQLLKQSGYKTIIAMFENPPIEAPIIAEAAEKHGLLNGNHFWFISGGITDSTFNSTSFLEQAISNPILLKALQGSAILHPDVYNERFENAWSSQNITFIRRLNKWNPLRPYHYQTDDYFQTQRHFIDGHHFMYDTVMTIGIGACNAQAKAVASNNSGSFSELKTHPHGEKLLQGIRSINFTGATGQIVFDDMERPGVRKVLTTDYAVSNLFPQGLGGPFHLDTDIYSAQSRTWASSAPFVYADGTNIPPKEYRPNQNYLPRRTRWVVFALMGIAMIFVISTMIWTYQYRNHRVVCAAQPIFLYLIGIGLLGVIFGVFAISWDEGAGWNESMLTSACIASEWLFFLGYTITYCALFTKILRVHKVLQFSKRRVKTINIIWPALVLILVCIVTLSISILKQNYRWRRVEINGISGESIGGCNGDINHGEVLLFFSVGIVVVVPMLLTGIMAWKTRDVDDIYSESSWIFIMIIVQVQVLVVGLPIYFYLQNRSAEGRLLGIALICWTFPMSTNGLLMIPKMIAVHKPELLESGKKRGQQSGVVVTGINDFSSGTRFEENRPISTLRM